MLSLNARKTSFNPCPVKNKNPRKNGVMCHLCNYKEMLKEAGLSPTAHRLRVLEVIGNNNFPLKAKEIYETIHRSRPINRVTVYRVLETLIDKGLIERISGGGRSFFYGLAPNAHHHPHPHFYCRQCGQMNCLRPESISMDMDKLVRVFPGQIQNVTVRVDGICKECLHGGKDR